MAMISYTELKPGFFVVIDGQPNEVIETSFLRMQQRKAVVQCRFKNLITGKVVGRNVHPSESFEEAEIDREDVVYLYHHRGEYWFSKLNDPSQRFKIEADVLGRATQFLKPNSSMSAITFNNTIITVSLPIKLDLLVTEAPPSDKGDTATGGKKQVTLETGGTVMVPLFINEGDVIRVNTDTGEYDERIQKSA